jgi:very-short-patch-repair endonuclease
MKSTDVFPTNYAANVVACKLWGVTGSPTESILTLALFNKLAHFYEGWICRVYSEHEYRQALADAKIDGGSFVLVPQWSVNQVGLVDLAVFIPGLDHRRPIVVAECDGHQFHERTPEQASKDKRRVRALQRLGIWVYPFTGTDVVRSSEESAQEIVEFVHARVNGMERRWFQDRASSLNGRLPMASAFPRHILGRERGSIHPASERSTPRSGRASLAWPIRST